MKDVKASIDFSLYTRKLGRFFANFHLTFFIIFIVLGLSAAVLFLNNILVTSTTDSTYVSPITPSAIDQTTLERLNELRTSDEAGNSNYQIPSGRINPLAE